MPAYHTFHCTCRHLRSPIGHYTIRNYSKPILCLHVFSDKPNSRQLQVGSNVRVHCTVLFMWKSLVQIPKQTTTHYLKSERNLLFSHISQSTAHSQPIIRRHKIKATFKQTKLATHTEWKIPVSHRYSNFSWWWAHSCPKHIEKLQ